METTSHLRGIAARRRGWTGLACLVAIAACNSGDRASKAGGTSGSAETGAVQLPALADADTHTPGGIVDSQSSGGQPSTAPAQPSGGEKQSDTGRAGEIARAPRANPNAPSKPRPTLTPGAPSDTNPTQNQPKATTGAAQSTQEPRDKYHPAPKDTVSQVVYTGWKYFNLNCARCHGEDVTGTTIAPHLIDSFKSGKVDHAEFWRVVHGSRAQRGMPNWSGLIDDEKLQAIYEYVKGRSDGKLHPGRPAQESG